MSANFKDYSSEVKAAIMASKKEICNQWGVNLVAEYQARTPVVTGNMRRGETFDVLPNNDGIQIGTTPEAYYAEWVELGSSKQKAQHILENTINDSSSKITSIANEIISSKMGG